MLSLPDSRTSGKSTAYPWSSGQGHVSTPRGSAGQLERGKGFPGSLSRLSDAARSPAMADSPHHDWRRKLSRFDRLHQAVESPAGRRFGTGAHPGGSRSDRRQPGRDTGTSSVVETGADPTAIGSLLVASTDTSESARLARSERNGFDRAPDSRVACRAGTRSERCSPRDPTRCGSPDRAPALNDAGTPIGDASVKRNLQSRPIALIHSPPRRGDSSRRGRDTRAQRIPAIERYGQFAGRS